MVIQDHAGAVLTFPDWVLTVPEKIKSEKVWQLIAYQKALYLYDLLWIDTATWIRDPRGQALARQMTASSDSICANIEEGYGRGFGKQLVYFYTVALGSARETKGRFYRAKAYYSGEDLNTRLSIISEVIALLLTEINRHLLICSLCLFALFANLLACLLLICILLICSPLPR
jgi:four helix bundle protein